MISYKVDYHHHSTGSDGHQTPHAVVVQALKDRVTHLCFTDHYPRPEETQDSYWKGQDVLYHNAKYVAEVAKLQREYKGKIDIRFGAELDWLEGYEDWMKKVIASNKFDYVLGSVHVMKVGNEWTSIDANRQVWEEIAGKLGGVEKFIQEYYRQRRLQIQSGLFDCVGHLDYIKLYNRQGDLFSEESSNYRAEVMMTLNELKKSKSAVEINTSGWRKAEEQFPSTWILQYMAKLGIPITIGSDGHGLVAEDYLDRAHQLARDAGFKSVLVFKNRKPIEVRI